LNPESLENRENWRSVTEVQEAQMKENFHEIKMRAETVNSFLEEGIH